MRKTIYTLVLAVIVAGFCVLMTRGLITSAQNANSSTTTSSNNNASKPRQPRRPRPRPSPAPEAAVEPAAAAETTPAAKPRAGRCDPNTQELTDLSGTYTGKVKHGDQPEMDGTLTITGNSFTMATGSETHSGRIVAVTTCGYTAVTVMPEGASHAHSLRAKRVGNSLTLMSVPGEPEKIMFTTGGGARRTRRHSARRPPPPPAPPSQQ